MRFEWDEAKDRANRRKHGVGLDVARLVFDDPFHLSLQDRHEGGEERWLTLGRVGPVVILLVAIPTASAPARKSSGSSRPERRPVMKERVMRKAPRKRRAPAPSRGRRASARAELAALAVKRERDIDTADIPEIKDWHGAQIGRFYRPVKKSVTIRLDADVLAWFKARGGKYQTALNRALREYIATRR